MEQDFINNLIIVGVITTLLLAISSYYLLFSRIKTIDQSFIPGWNREPADPVYGDLHEVIATGNLHSYLMKQHKGGRVPVVSFWWRKERVVSVCSVQAFKDSEGLYNRPGAIFRSCSVPLHGPKGIQDINDDEWKERRQLLHGSLRGENLHLFFNCFVEIAHEKVAAWTPGKPIVLMSEMFQMTLKAILDTSLGNIFEDYTGISELADLYDKCKCEMDECIFELPPAVDSERHLKFQKNLKCLMEILKKMLEIRRNLPGNSKQPNLPLLDTLINSGASDEVILSDMVTFLGGYHTSSYFATWMFYFLARHSDIQEKLYQDIFEKVGDDYGTKLKAYTFTSTSYLRQVLDEGFRTSLTTNFVAQYSNEDMILDGYSVPAKTPIIHAFGVTMRDDTIWEEPEKFNPDRFAPGSPHAKRGPEFRPFGVSNIRRCPANQFTYLMISVFVAVLVRQFVLVTVTEDDGHAPEKKHGIATSPKDELQILVEFRENNQ